MAVTASAHGLGAHVMARSMEWPRNEHINLGRGLVGAPYNDSGSWGGLAPNRQGSGPTGTRGTLPPEIPPTPFHDPPSYLSPLSEAPQDHSPPSQPHSLSFRLERGAWPNMWQQLVPLEGAKPFGFKVSAGPFHEGSDTYPCGLSKAFTHSCGEGMGQLGGTAQRAVQYEEQRRRVCKHGSTCAWVFKWCMMMSRHPFRRVPDHLPL